MAGIKELKVLAPLLLSKAMSADSLQRKRVNSFLCKQMGESKGLWLKLGQFLGTGEGHWEELKTIPLGEDLPQIPEEEFLPYLHLLMSEAKLNFDAEFSSIEFPGHSASLSQVHKVIDDKGQAWALKVQLPNIDQVVKDQLSLLGLFGKFEGFQEEKKTFQTKEYHNTLADGFEKELDYSLERGNIQSLAPLEKRFENAHIVKLHPQVQSDRILCLSWEEGDDWNTVLNTYDVTQKRHIGNTLITQFLYQYFIMGISQGDFHPGNFKFTRAGALHWYDFGQVLTPSKKQRAALYRLIESLRDEGEEELGPLLNAWDFDLKKLAPIAHQLPLVLSKIFDPFITNQAFNIKEWNLKETINLILEENRWWLRTAGSPKLFLSIRAWMGLLNMLEELNTPFYFSQIWSELSYEMHPLFKGVTLDHAVLQEVTLKDLAKKLTIKISEGDITKVEITLPARALEEVPSLLSSQTKLEMEKAGIDITKVVEHHLKQGLKSETVVDFTDGTKHYLVELK